MDNSQGRVGGEMDSVCVCTIIRTCVFLLVCVYMMRVCVCALCGK